MLRTVQVLHVSVQYKFNKYYNRSKFYDIRTVRVFTIHVQQIHTDTPFLTHYQPLHVSAPPEDDILVPKNVSVDNRSGYV